jgi:integrase/recombinase XerD
MTESLAVYLPGQLAPQAETDARLVQLWLHGRPKNTRVAYGLEAECFLAFVGKPLRLVTLGELQAYADSLADLAPATQTRRLNVVKSLFTFAAKLGYVSFNVAAALKPPPMKQTRAERILPEMAVHRMLALELHPRNHALLRLLYGAGLRVSELAALTWRDLQDRAEGTGQVTVYGKGGKTRAVLLPPAIWEELQALRGSAGSDDPVFRSRRRSKRGTYHLHPSQVERIVLAAAQRAGLAEQVSPHWLRHAHASHALDRGAPIHLVQATLGHASVATTSKYLHARPTESSSKYLAI